MQTATHQTKRAPPHTHTHRPNHQQLPTPIVFREAATNGDVVSPIGPGLATAVALATVSVAAGGGMRP